MLPIQLQSPLSLFVISFILADILWLTLGGMSGRWTEITSPLALGFLGVLNALSLLGGYVYLRRRYPVSGSAPKTSLQDKKPEVSDSVKSMAQAWDALPPTVIRTLHGTEILDNKAFRELKIQSGGHLVLPDFFRITEQLSGVYWEIPQGPGTETFEIIRYPVSGGWGTLYLPAKERKLQDGALRESQAFLQTTIGQSPLGLIILDARTKVVKICNDGAKEILGIPLTRDLAGRVLQTPDQPWELLDLDRSPFLPEEDPFNRVFSLPRNTADQVIVRRSDGRERYVVLTSAPIYDQNGEFFAAFLALLDASELHKTEQQLQSLNRELELRVEERTKELVETQKQLMEAERLAGLGALVAGVAHEINTPVGVSVTAASYLEESSEKLMELYHSGKMKKSDLEAFLKTSRDSSRIVQENLARASHLIRNFKMISVDQSTDMKRKFRLKQYILDVFESLPPPNRLIRIELDVQGDERLELSSYPGTFSQILTNLYMNSCIHGFEGRSEGRIALTFHQEEDRLLLTYADNGAGMDEGTLAKIYEPFFTTRRNSGGTGLGMNIVYNLVNRKLGGRITAESAPGAGATFQIQIPLDPPDQIPAAAEMS